MSKMPPNALGKAEAALKIAVLSRNSETLKSLGEHLNTPDGSLQLQFWPADATHLPAMVEQEHPGLLLLETSGARSDEMQGLEELMARHHDMAVILICNQQNPDFLLSAIRLGVREVIQTPFSASTIQQAVTRVRERIAAQGMPRSPGKLLAFMPCKGGSGATFIATNLAYAISTEHKRVCLIDLNLHFGDAALHISEQAPTSTVVDLAAQIDRLDGALLESSMLRVSPWLDLLAAPESPASAVDVRPESVERLISVARGCYDFVLVDLSRTLEANVIKVLDCADRIYLVLQPTLPFIRDAGRLLQIFASLGYSKGHTRILLNRFDKNGEISLPDIENALGMKVEKTLPNSFGVVAESINHGHPILEFAPRDPVARALQDLAREITQAGNANHSAWWQRLFKRAA